MWYLLSLSGLTEGGAVSQAKQSWKRERHPSFMFWWGSWHMEWAVYPTASLTCHRLSVYQKVKFHLPGPSRFRGEHDLFLKGGQSSRSHSSCCARYGIWYNPHHDKVAGVGVCPYPSLPLKGGCKQGPSILCLGCLCLPRWPWSATAILGPGPQPKHVRTEGREEAGFFSARLKFPCLGAPCWA